MKKKIEDLKLLDIVYNLYFKSCGTFVLKELKVTSIGIAKESDGVITAYKVEMEPEDSYTKEEGIFEKSSSNALEEGVDFPSLYFLNKNKAEMKKVISDLVEEVFVTD